MEILQMLVCILFLIPAFIFGLYGIFVLYYGRPRRTGVKEKERYDTSVGFEPFVSVVIPTHNEELIITKKIENLLSSQYPREKLELIFADDSDDSTPKIIKEYSEKDTRIRLLRFDQRMGYSPSMIAGCKSSRGEIVVLNDAGSFLDTQAISKLVAHFKDPSIGVVTGKDVILNLSEEVGKSESLYQKMYNFLRTSETNMDSTFYIKGEATAVRRDLILDLDKCGETFDTAVGLFVRQKGYRVVYDESVKFYEYAPSNHSGRVDQKTIRAANLVKVLWRYKGMMFNRKHGKYGLLILPMNFGMLVIAPLAIFAGFTVLVTLTFFDPGSSIILWAFFASPIVLFLIFSRRIVTTFFEFEYSLLRALYQIAFTRRAHDKIDKVLSTRR